MKSTQRAALHSPVKPRLDISDARPSSNSSWATSRDPVAKCQMLERDPTFITESLSADHPIDPIHRHIEVHADQQPDAIAVTFQKEQFTYEELNRRANQLAHYLISLGIGAETRVAIC